MIRKLRRKPRRESYYGHNSDRAYWEYFADPQDPTKLEERMKDAQEVDEGRSD